MTEAGLSKIDYDQPAAPVLPDARAERERELLVPPELQEALAGNEKAREYFTQLAPSYRRLYIRWISSAKREETRRHRAAEAIGLLEQGKKLGLG